MADDDCARTHRRRCLALATLSLGLVAASVSAVQPTAAAAATPVRGSFTSSIWGDLTADLTARTTGGKNSASADPGSLYTLENSIGARTVWKQLDASKRQITGQGITVALLDSGTAAVPGLDAPGKITYGPDLSIEGNGPLADSDTFGHGTFMGGIIATHDPATLTAKTIDKLDPSVQLGVAPDANLLSMKLATTDGSTDVSQVIAALNWVTEHQTAPDGTKVRVVNLSFGTDSIQPYQLDPLAAAAENAWRHGLVVVVSGGNDGNDTTQLTDPAIDPYVISVGASDAKDSVTGWASPSVASFSDGGSDTRHVDLLAPGTSLVSLRDPGSEVDTDHPEGRVLGDTTGRLFRGSGTSQAAAVVSGAVALLLQAYPNDTPDQIKAALTKSADPVAASPRLAGAGELDVAAALTAAKPATGLVKTLGGLTNGLGLTSSGVQNFPISTGQGSLDAARGDSVLTDADGNVLSGEVDVQGVPWNAKAWWAAASSLTSWQGGTWLGTRWTGDNWAPSNGLSAVRWSTSRWSSARWSDADWDSARWSSARWSSARWSSARWSSARWSSVRWSSNSWY